MKCYIHCLDNLKVYKFIIGGYITKKLASFRWKVVLVFPWWRHNKKADFTFVFTTTSGKEGLPMLADEKFHPVKLGTCGYYVKRILELKGILH